MRELNLSLEEAKTLYSNRKKTQLESFRRQVASNIANNCSHGDATSDTGISHLEEEVVNVMENELKLLGFITSRVECAYYDTTKGTFPALRVEGWK